MNDLIQRKKIVAYHKISARHNLAAHFDIYRGKDVLITVDDGDISFYHHLFPLIKAHQVPAILFVITGLVDTKIPFWWDELVYLLGAEEGEKKVWEVKTWPNHERLAYLQQLRDKSSKRPLEQTQLTTEQLQEMQAAGVIIANHSHTHPMFDQCTEDELREEFSRSRQFFEARQLKGYDLFAYPNGNYNPVAERVAKEEGINYAFLFDHKLPNKIFDPYRISRLSVTDQTSARKLHFILSGWHTKLLPFRRKIYNVLHGR
ncbi:polysaccharide deacetylase [Pontibacter ummariensis]|uniref:Polysaccharide deacetylase n=1 Tax=Pontibacter ummariensis TaxID=1610492 RepID=A0A239EJ06_9BACT|nr:polysaccharide deacetylase family protein [Pontibacter ummariensis]PRY13286.1 polysaccharide deacetylase [Pontibacter ummariensis]SNS44607.1 Polysaccharide deacetylase [Pontibacter ummariensis]